LQLFCDKSKDTQINTQRFKFIFTPAEHISSVSGGHIMKWNFSSAKGEGYEKAKCPLQWAFHFFPSSSCYTPYGVFPDTPQISIGHYRKKKNFYWCFRPFIAFEVGAFVK
jgi:hypothetical protein